MASSQEPRLSGGSVTAVVRVGDTVRRPAGPCGPVVHALLRHLEGVGFDGAPRLLGIDEQGREILEYVPGEMLDGAAFADAGVAAVAEAARLIRRFHDAAAGFTLSAGLAWPYEAPWPGEPRIPCHNDLAPRNTVYRDGRAVALIDWDLAAAGPPVWDLAHAAWQFVPLVDDAQARRLGWRSPPDRAARLRALCDEYGLAAAERRGFAGAVVARMASSAAGIDARARAGEPAFRRLAEEGVPSDIRTQARWLARRADWVDKVLVGAT